MTAVSLLPIGSWTAKGSRRRGERTTIKDILLKLIAPQSVIGELSDIARENKQQAAAELLRLEPRINDLINQTFVLLDQLPINEAETIAVVPS